MEKEVNAGSVHKHYFYNDDWQMLEERGVNGEGTTIESNDYVWSARYVDSPIVRFHDDNGDGDLFDAGDNTHYYTTDANHNVTAVIDAATGNVATYYTYTPYGQATAYDPNWSNPATPTEDGPLYCGYFFDAESELYQVRNRYYDSSIGGFVTRDPIGYAARDENLYRYVGGNPMIRVDPSGLEGGGTVNPPGSDNVTVVRRIGKPGGRIEVDILVSTPEFADPGEGHTNFGELLANVKKQVGKGQCIGKLEIEGHGSDDSLDLDDHPSKYDDTNSPNANIINAANAAYVAAELNKLPFCCPCTIYLSACNSGTSKDPNCYAQQIADGTGCTTVGAGGYMKGTHLGGNADSDKYYGSEPDWKYEYFRFWYKGGRCREETATHKASQGGVFVEYPPSKLRECKSTLGLLAKLPPMIMPTPGL